MSRFLLCVRPAAVEAWPRYGSTAWNTFELLGERALPHYALDTVAAPS